MNKKISIIGGGVSGLTTGLTLQLLGFDTTIYAEHLVNSAAPRDPRFASLYPAASVIPHSISSSQLDLLFPASLKLFDALKEQQFAPLVMHRHFELFEQPVEFPSYGKFLHDFNDIADSSDELIPRRHSNTDLHGWVFNCFVAEWPDYMQELYKMYKESGGRITIRRISKEEVAALPGDIVINCSGVGTVNLFEDPAEHELIRGHLIHIKNKRPVMHDQNQICSYNYTPGTSTYATPEGKPSDVYFYPANGKWILGGSRQRGTINAEGAWEGTEHKKTRVIAGREVPTAIIDLNNEILQTTFGITIDQEQPNMEVHVGYRYTRKNASGGLRLEPEETGSKFIIHNYGHGGAGVTISWGCALNVLKLVQSVAKVELKTGLPNLESPLLNNLQLRLHQVYLNDFHSSNP